MSDAALLLPAAIAAQIIAHAQADAPHEACGLLHGRDGAVSGLVRGRNLARDPAMRYHLDPVTLLQQCDWEDRGEALLAVYHSHLRGAAYPSAVDAAYAWYPQTVTVICSLAAELPSLRGYTMIQQPLARRPAAVQPVAGESALWSASIAGGYAFVRSLPAGREQWFAVQVTEVLLCAEPTWLLESPPKAGWLGKAGEMC